MINVLVADDELLSLQNITLLLAGRSEVGQVFEAMDGKQALKQFEQYKPDLVFLDIEMPLMSGLEVARRIGPSCIIIFVTAYDQYAISAFELNAIDYLLKPYDDKRFYKAFERALLNVEEQKRFDYSQLCEMFDYMMEEREQRYKSNLVVKDPGRLRFIEVMDVNYITGSGNYAELHLSDGKVVLHRETMTSLENQLDPRNFVRIHRSSIVRVSYISELLSNDRGDYTIVLKNKVELPVSRGNKFRLQQFMQTG